MSKASGRFGRRILGSEGKDTEEGSSDTVSEDREMSPVSPGIRIHVTTIVEQAEERAEDVLRDESESVMGLVPATPFERS